MLELSFLVYEEVVPAPVPLVFVVFATPDVLIPDPDKLTPEPNVFTPPPNLVTPSVPIFEVYVLVAYVGPCAVVDAEYLWIACWVEDTSEPCPLDGL